MIELNFFQPGALSKANTDQRDSDTGYFYHRHHVTDNKNPKSWYQTNQKNKILIRQRENTVPSSVLKEHFVKRRF